MRYATNPINRFRGGTLRVVAWTIVVTLLAVAGVVFVISKVPTSADSGLPGDSDPSDEAPAPVGGHRFGKNAVTESDVRISILSPWLRQAWRADGLPVDDGPGIPAEAWKSLVNAMIEEETGGPSAVGYEALQELAENHVAYANANPWSAYIIGRALPVSHPLRKGLLATAFEEFDRLEGQEILAYHAGAEWLLSPDTTEPGSSSRPLAFGNEFGVRMAASSVATRPRPSLASLADRDPVEACMEALAAALSANNGFSDMPDRLAAYLLFEGRREALFEYLHEAMWKTVSNEPTVEPWLRMWVEGKHFHRFAWDARGGGYSNTVTSEGSALFKRNMEKARRLVGQSWNEGPDHAGVAAEMIALSLSLGEAEAREQFDHWFDQAGEVQVDYAEAYSNVLWGLRPRWHGSHRHMLVFGKKCLDSGRFDSSGPWWFLQAHRDVASEWDLPYEYFPEMDADSSLERLFTGFEQEPKREEWRWHDRSQAVMTYFSAGDYFRAASWLDKLDERPIHPAVLRTWGSPPAAWVIGKTKAYSGQFGETLIEAEKKEDKFEAAEALGIYSSVLEEGSEVLPNFARDYVRDRAEAMRLESEFRDSGVCKRFVPSESGAGWFIAGGTGGRELTFRSSEWDGYARATCRARIGPAFVMTGVVKVTRPGSGAAARITFGYPELQGKERWGAVEFLWVGENAGVRLVNGGGVAEETNELSLMESAEFRLAVSPDGISLNVDGVDIWNQVPTPRRFVKEAYAQVGFGAGFADQNTTIVFSDIVLSRSEN